MDGSALFLTVLEPGERLLWTGQPRKYNLGLAGLNFVILAVGLAWIFTKTLRLQIAPLPLVLQIELILVATMFAWVGYLLLSRLLRAWNTAYALTERRLLMAVGPSRDEIRMVPLAELAAVKAEYRPKIGKVLVFCRQGTAPVWTFLESGQPDKWNPVWALSDIEQVRQLIETARTAATARAA